MKVFFLPRGDFVCLCGGSYYTGKVERLEFTNE